MSDLGRGTGNIPTIDANGAVLNPMIANLFLISIPPKCGVEVVMNPAQWSTIVGMPDDNVVIDVSTEQRPLAVPLEKQNSFGGIPLRLSIYWPKGTITALSKSSAVLPDGHLAEPLIAAQIVNLAVCAT